MNTLALPLPGSPGRRLRLFGYVADIFGGMRDGLRLARIYNELNALSDAELARRGIKQRGDVARAALAALG
jgi:hypothetical protein